jgi:hypothetical protein
MEWSATRREVVLVGFSRLAFLFCFRRPRLFCSFNLLASTTSAVRTRALGARFKLLSVGAGSKHGDLCNEQISDSNERFNLNRGGSMTTQAQGQTRAVAAKKNHLRNPSGGECKFSRFPSSEELVLYSRLACELSCITKPSFSGVVWPVDKRHRSMAKRRAA